MSRKEAPLEQAFLDKQRSKLTALRQQILGVRGTEVGEEAGTNSDINTHAHEAEDDAQRLATLELQDNLTAFDDARLGEIERALQKLEEGSYGLSDSSGAPIPLERLEAYPEARYTLEEQTSRDARARS